MSLVIRILAVILSATALLSTVKAGNVRYLTKNTSETQREVILIADGIDPPKGKKS